MDNEKNNNELTEDQLIQDSQEFQDKSLIQEDSKLKNQSKPETKGRKKKKWPLVIVLIALVIVPILFCGCCGGIALLTGGDDKSTDNSSIANIESDNETENVNNDEISNPEETKLPDAQETTQNNEVSSSDVPDSSTTNNSDNNLLDDIADMFDPNSDYVKFVKKGTNSEYPGVTYGDAFDYYFANPKWKYFESDTGVDVVEFTGKCLYRDVEVDATIQWQLDVENGTFELGYVAFNDVPQDMLTSLVLVSTVFDSYYESIGGAPAPDLDESDNNYEVGLPPIEDYDVLDYENGAPAWNYYDSYTDEDWEKEYVGTWEDTWSGRCYMTITCDSGNYEIKITWGGGIYEYGEWTYYGTINEYGTIVSYGEYRTVYTANGDGVITSYDVNYTGQEGDFYLLGDTLYWDDYYENAGGECAFVKTNY